MTSVISLINLVSILPFFVSLALDHRHDHLKDVQRLLTGFRVLRILNILALARHSTGLRALGYTLKQIKQEIGLLTMFVSVLTLLFSSLLYFAEHEEADTKFVSFPADFWWNFKLINRK